MGKVLILKDATFKNPIIINLLKNAKWVSGYFTSESRYSSETGYCTWIPLTIGMTYTLHLYSYKGNSPVFGADEEPVFTVGKPTTKDIVFASVKYGICGTDDSNIDLTFVATTKYLLITSVRDKKNLAYLGIY